MTPTNEIIFQAIGKIDGKIGGIDDRLKRLEGNTEFIRSALTQDGKQIAEIGERCRLRGHQISQLMTRVGGVEEATGRFRFKDANEKEKKVTIHWGITTLLSLMTVLLTLSIWLLSK